MKNNVEDLEFFNARVDKGLIERLNTLSKSDFKILTYTEAIKILIDSKKEFEVKVEWGVDLTSEHEKFVVDKFKLPCVITN